MNGEPLIVADWRNLIFRCVVLLFVLVSGYISFQIAKDESLQHWLRLILVYYSLFSALVGIGVLAIIVWKLSLVLGSRYDWWTLP